MQGFSPQSLADKLAKLNNSQQSIETLSHWCIFHRRSVKQVVDIWERQFFTAPREQRVPFLFLANDILQNSRRKGNGEFVNEFWRVLPATLKDVMKYGDDSNRNTVLRLIDIWEERKVFGSHPQGLRVELLGRDAPSSTKNNTELLPEKLVAVYKAFNDKLVGEDELVEKCNSLLVQMESVEKQIDISAISGQETGAMILEELQHEESTLADCIQQLEATEIARSSIVFQLKETLRDQEAKLTQMRLLLQAAHSQSESNRVIQQHVVYAMNGQVLQQPEENGSMENYEDLSRSDDVHTSSSHEDEEYVPADAYVPVEQDGYVPTEVKKFSAAEVAAKLASSTAMLSSVLSSLAADSNAVVAPLSLPLPSTNHQGLDEDVATDPDQSAANPDQEDDDQEPPTKKPKHDLPIDADKVENDALMSSIDDDGISTGMAAPTVAATDTSTNTSQFQASSFWQGLGFPAAAATISTTTSNAGTCAPPENYQQSNPLSFFTSPPQQ